MNVRTAVLAVGLSMASSTPPDALAQSRSEGVAATSRGEEPDSADVTVVALRELDAVSISEDDYFAWSGPALCDQEGDVFFLVAPHVAPRDVGDPSAAPVPPAPRAVLRVSADGEERTSIDPAVVREFADALEVATATMALDRHGNLFLVVWVRWRGTDGGPEKGRQYLVSFDEEGRYSSHREIDWQEMVVRRLEVFGSGELLLRGVRPHAGVTRLSILPAAGGSLEDVIGWPNWPAEAVDEPSATATPLFDQMVRGGDGRIYMTEQDAQQDEVVVYVLEPFGHSREAFRLAPMPGEPRLAGWKAAGQRLAAAYQERRPGDDPSEGRRGDWWIAVYGDIAGYVARQVVYGPAPGPPICYRYSAARDRFTFLKDAGTLVTMSR